MKVLIGCEFSGVVREAFRKLGHDAWSCDLLDAEDGSKYHYTGDIFKVIQKLQKDKWIPDLAILHPPCTYLCNSGVSWLQKDPKRWDELKIASRFFKDLYDLPIKKICVENPIPHKHAKLPKYTQIIQPYQFGHLERKATCLWLKNLPPLVPTNDVKEQMLLLPKKDQQRIHYTSPGKDRWKIRSRTFLGIADAMANQWGREQRA